MKNKERILKLLENQELINSRLIDLLGEEEVRVGQLETRVETLEKMIAVIPEFYEYWKRLNACGYQD